LAERNPTLPWFRLYHEILDDEKLRLLAFEDRWHYVAILCCKAKGLLDADVSWEMLQRRMAVRLGVQARELEEIHRRLLEVGLVDDAMQPCAWENRQRRSDHDPTGAARQRRFRDKRVSNALRNGYVTDAEGEGETEKETTARSGRAAYPDEFESAWREYPRRHGDNPKKRAFKAWNARLREGHTAEEMSDGIRRYAAWCEATGKLGQETVKQAATFLGPDKGFTEEWPTRPERQRRTVV
jgi:hypothetical protein